MKGEVFIYVVRHGEKETEGDDPGLTEKGRRQVRATAQLLKLPIVAGYHSGMKRTRETLHEMLFGELHALAYPSDSPIGMYSEPAVGYKWFVEDPASKEYSLEEAMEQIAVAAETDGRKMFSHWLTFYPPILLCRGRFTQTLIEIARRHVDEWEGADDVRVLIASHSPVAESATSDPWEMSCLGEGDVICYRVYVGAGFPEEAEVHQAFIRKCPFKVFEE